MRVILVLLCISSTQPAQDPKMLLHRLTQATGMCPGFSDDARTETWFDVLQNLGRQHSVNIYTQGVGPLLMLVR